MKSKIFKSGKFIFNASLVCAIALICAQSTNASNTNSAKYTEELKRQYDFQEVKSYQALPDVPTFTGHTEFKRGLIYPHQKGFTCIQYKMDAKEDQQTVLRWYQEALKMYKWQVSSNTTSNVIQANKQGNIIAITLVRSGKPGFGTDIDICYTAMNNR
jgi:hypothetical protein